MEDFESVFLKIKNPIRLEEQGFKRLIAVNCEILKPR
jgi:hypothetical protein